MRSRPRAIRPSPRRFASGIAWMILAIPSASALAEDTPLSIADLEAYRLALQSRTDPGSPLVRFRDLWDRPVEYLGRSVRVEGRVARLFRQGQVGEFPALTEAWITSKSGDPFCLIFPAIEGRPSPTVGASVRFGGTFLKRLRYQGGDVARAAPLIVGPEAPAVTAPTGLPTEGPSWSSADWVMGLGAASMVAMILARRHLSRPAPASTFLGPPPVFADGEAADVEESRQDEEGAADEDHA